MEKVFEDEFMDIQTSIISLCLELVNNKADKIYAYGSIEEKSMSFNAFYVVEGEVVTINKLNIGSNMMWEFLDLGASDLKKIKEACHNYDMPIPRELKMIYDVSTGKFDANYKYEEVCSARTGINAGQVFANWMNEIKSLCDF